MVSETDISYIAGLFDGEGCITYKQYMRKRKHQKKAYPTWSIRMEMSMTDKNVMELVHETLGCGSLNERNAAEFHIPNYTAPSATSGTGVYCFASGMNNIASPNNSQFFQWSGLTWNGTAAVASINIYATQTTANYLFQPGTQVSLYGIGTAP